MFVLASLTYCADDLADVSGACEGSGVGGVGEGSGVGGVGEGSVESGAGEGSGAVEAFGERLGEDRRFSSLADCVSDKTLKAIHEMGFTEMMEIQHRSIRPLLEGK